MQGTRSVEEEEEEEHWQEVGHRSPVSIANGYRPVLQGKSRGCPQSNELSRGPPELVQFVAGVHISARALYALNLIWFGNIFRLSQWGEGG
jgi:hypothetical protein